MTAHRLGPAMQDDVGAHHDRALAQRRGEGVVADDEGADRVRGCADGRDVGHLHHGIGRRLDPDGIRSCERLDHGGGVGDVHATQGDHTALVKLAQAQCDAGVGELGRDDHGADRQQVHDRVGRGHARGEGDGLTALEWPDSLLQGTHAERAVARVFDRPARVVGRREFDGVIDRIAGLGRWAPAVHELRVYRPGGGRLLRHGADPNAPPGH